jgi:hypothetical protein
MRIRKGKPPGSGPTGSDRGGVEPGSGCGWLDLYDTTSSDGACGSGTVFKLTPWSSKDGRYCGLLRVRIRQNS